ncbi:hypothetical protein [Undibacterium squillarum]|uniref:hypothetical protein n=1 Tax=Undibacterium squillarum TaxID=1131567 RepID=UPI0035B03697
MNGWNTYPHSNSRHSGMLLALGLHVLLISAWWQMQHQPWRSHNSTSSAMELVFVAPPQPAPQAAPQAPVRTSNTPPVSAKRSKPELPRKTTNESVIQPVETHAVSTPATDNPPAEPATAATPRSGPDLHQLKASAGRIDKEWRGTTMGKIQMAQDTDPGTDEKLGKGVKKAEKKECLKAYSGIGLLAIAPLLVSTVVDTGCKW